MQASDYPLLQVMLSIVWFFVMVIWFFVVAAVLIDLFRSHMSGWAKAGWFVFVVFLPLIGLLAYLIVRGPQMQRRAMEDVYGQTDTVTTGYVPDLTQRSTADEISKLVDLRDRGVLTVEEFEKQKAVLLR